jgi:hypothetical protein
VNQARKSITSQLEGRVLIDRLMSDFFTPLTDRPAWRMWSVVAFSARLGLGPRPVHHTPCPSIAAEAPLLASAQCLVSVFRYADGH